jgi:hypothetical protein
MVDFAVRQLGYERKASRNKFVDVLERGVAGRSRLMRVLDDNIVW